MSSPLMLMRSGLRLSMPPASTMEGRMPGIFSETSRTSSWICFW